MFKALNTEKTGKLTLDEFYNMYDVTDLDWKVTNSSLNLNFSSCHLGYLIFANLMPLKFKPFADKVSLLLLQY